MPKIEVDLPDRIDSDIDRLVEDDEFVNREQAIEELLSRGVSAYNVDSDDEPEEEDLFTQTVEDQRDPAIRDEEDEGDYTF